MPCPHRFLGLHLTDSLFPNWEVEYLFVGTFNPLWDRPDANNADISMVEAHISGMRLVPFLEIPFMGPIVKIEK